MCTSAQIRTEKLYIYMYVFFFFFYVQFNVRSRRAAARPLQRALILCVLAPFPCQLLYFKKKKKRKEGEKKKSKQASKLEMLSVPSGAPRSAPSSGGAPCSQPS